MIEIRISGYQEAEIMLASTALYIFFTILAVIASLLLIGGLIFSIMRSERRRLSEASGDDNRHDSIDFKLSAAISARQEFSLYCIEAIEYQDMLQSLGEAQFEAACSIFLKRIKRLFFGNVRVAVDGDRIYILAVGKSIARDNDKFSQMIILEAANPVSLGGTLNVYFDIAVGVAGYPVSGKTVRAILENIDLALLAAKRQGYNHYVIYDEQLSAKESDEYKKYLEIKEAIKNDEFTLYYQPIVDISTKEVYALESLLRWNHKTKGILAPQVFLSLLEQSGDINWVGIWSLDQLLRQKEQWQKLYPTADFLLSINLSPKQIRNAEISSELRRLVRKHHVSANRIILELSESTMLISEDAVKANISKLRAQGFNIAIDNYTAQIINLQSLSELEITHLKLENRFLSAAKAGDKLKKGILEIIVSYCQENNIKLAVMGVETDEEVSYALERGIVNAQGYRYSRPKTAKQAIQDVILTPW